MHSCVKGKQDCSTNTKQRQKTHVKHRITSINTRQKSINTFYGEHDWYTLTGHFVGNTVLVPSWILFCLQNMMEPSLDDVYTIFWPYHPNVAAEIGKMLPNPLSKFFNLLFIYFGERVNFSLSFLFWQELHSMWSSATVPICSKVWCHLSYFQRWSSGCNKCLFALSAGSSLPIFLWPENCC